MTDAQPKRCWFRFSLRMMFVLVAVASVPMCWVGYQLNWIRQRHRFLREHRQFDYNEMRMWGDDRFPWSLRLFGEREKWVVFAPANETDEAAKLFPEARVVSP